jgi:hypothetical protein
LENLSSENKNIHSKYLQRSDYEQIKRENARLAALMNEISQQNAKDVEVQRLNAELKTLKDELNLLNKMNKVREDEWKLKEKHEVCKEVIFI